MYAVFKKTRFMDNAKKYGTWRLLRPIFLWQIENENGIIKLTKEHFLL